MNSVSVSRVSLLGIITGFVLVQFAVPVAAQVQRPAQSVPTALPARDTPTASLSETPPYRRPSPIPAPPAAATWEYKHDPVKNTFTLHFDWLSVPGAAGYAVAITDAEDDWQPEKVVTIRSGRIVPNLRSGVYYVHVAALLKTGKWSKIYTWRTVTPIVLSPSPTPAPSPGPDPAEVLGIRSRVEEIINALRNGTISSIAPQPESEPDIVAIPELPGLTGDAKNKTVPAKKQRYTCNCDKTCKTIYSCSEAYFQLNACSCAHLDADEDGVPCENKCGDE